MSDLTVSLSPHVRADISTRRVMLLVVAALVPTLIAGCWVFGLEALYTVALAVGAAVAAEALTQSCLKKPLTLSDGSAVVTGMLLGLSLPAGCAWYVPVCGAAFAIVIAKQVFGGLGNNFVNPALAGRAFLLACWPVQMTAYPGAMDAVASATPLAQGLTGTAWYMDAFLGNIPGSIGEVSKLALLIGAAVLLLSRVIDWRIPLSYLGALAALTFAFGGDGIGALLTGGVVMGAFFMATDYVTSPATAWGRVIFGLGCGIVTYAIRTWGAYPEGVTYAILFMNVAAPLIERWTRPRKYGEVKTRA